MRVKSCTKKFSVGFGEEDEPMFRSSRSERVRPAVENVRVDSGVLQVPEVD